MLLYHLGRWKYLPRCFAHYQEASKQRKELGQLRLPGDLLCCLNYQHSISCFPIKIWPLAAAVIEPNIVQHMHIADTCMPVSTKLLVTLAAAVRVKTAFRWCKYTCSRSSCRRPATHKTSAALQPPRKHGLLVLCHAQS